MTKEASTVVQRTWLSNLLALTMEPRWITVYCSPLTLRDTCLPRLLGRPNCPRRKVNADRQYTSAGQLPVMALLQRQHFLAKMSPKHSAQYGFSSRDVNFSPASTLLQLVHVKHSRCQGVFLYVIPPLLITCPAQVAFVCIR